MSTNSDNITNGVLNPEFQSQVLTMHYGEHLSFSAIARKLGINRKSVARIIRRPNSKCLVNIDLWN